MKKLLSLLILMLLASTLIPIAKSVVVETKLYALIVTGGGYSEETGTWEFAVDGDYAYDVLSHYDFEEIIFLKEASVTLENVQNALTYLKEKTNMASIVFIYFSTHGGGLYRASPTDWKLDDVGARFDEDGDEGLEISEDKLDPIYGDPNKWYGVDESLKLKGSGSTELYWDDDLRKDLEDLRYHRLILIHSGCKVGNETCFSGGFIDDLSAPNRIIITASNETRWAWQHTDDPCYGIFDHAFFSALDSDDPVSMKEAFDYAYEVVQNAQVVIDHAGQTPWLDDNGNGYPTFILNEDYLDSDDGELAAETFLEGSWIDVQLEGDINDDGYVNVKDAILLGVAFGSTPEDPNWNPDADLNDDGYVNSKDAVILGVNFGEKVF